MKSVILSMVIANSSLSFSSLGMQLSRLMKCWRPCNAQQLTRFDKTCFIVDLLCTRNFLLEARVGHICLTCNWLVIFLGFLYSFIIKKK